MSPRSKAQFAEIRRTRREQILDAARRIFAEHGFYATKMSDIARTAGVSQGTVYHYFRSKDDLFMALLSTWTERLEDVVREVSGTSSSATDKMWMMNEVALAFLQADEDLLPVIVEFWAYALRNPDASASFRHLFETMQQSVTEIITQGVASGEFRSIDVETLSALPMVILDGVILLSLVVGQDLVDPEQVINKTQQLIFEGLWTETRRMV